MRKVRNALLVATGIVFGACATQTFRSDEAPEYVVTRDPTPFYLSKPRNEGTPDAALSAETRVKLLRQQAGYSLVLLEDSRQGYVANSYLTKASPGSQQRPFGSPEAGPSPRSKRRASPTPTPESSQPLETPVPQTSAPPTSPATPPDSQAAPEEVPSPTPAPEAPIEKPKFRL